ncbi:MAG: glutamate--cysteine ligase [Gammaproteobacteria bacterium]|nr:glutamate--cysteine ligase [Gammaproteobacteria bacterium]
MTGRPESLAGALALVRGRPELGALRRGIEKESLRVTPSGALAVTPHPPGLGSPLTHPHITTDFSEAQLELITAVHASAEDVLGELADIHRFVHANVGDELLWAASMPCILGPEAEIPVARFGSSNAGRSKTVYRMGLSYRYGRLMQTISGIHYNFSVPETLMAVLAGDRTAAADFATERYFALIRNFRRYSWLLIYLFGASPAVCKSFLRRADADRVPATRLEVWDEGTLHLPHATSLRMGRLGYQSDAQSSLHISYNGLAQYAATMRDALTKPFPPFEAIGVQVDGEYRQLSTALLQIENEFYGTIRPKRRVRSGERPLDALHDRGVEYVEVRCMDLDPFQPLGIDAVTCRFLDVFLLYCLLAESPPDSRRESEAMLANQTTIVERGREPGLKLAAGNGKVPAARWASELLDHCAQVAVEIDAVTGNGDHGAAVAAQRRKVLEPSSTPSARVLSSLRELKLPFARFAMQRSSAHRAAFTEPPLTAERRAELTAMSEASLAEQARLEAADSVPFDEYLARYLKLAYDA